MKFSEVPDKLSRHIRVDGDCWVWMGARSGKGYGSWRGLSAHRAVWESLNGKVPEGLELDHCVCINRACCNPGHLEPVTHAENVRRAVERRTHCLKGLHRLEGENLYVYPEGSAQAGVRRCKACLDAALNVDAERKREARNAFPAMPRLPRTHCYKGHEFTPENTYVYPAGTKQAGLRRCLQCYRAPRQSRSTRSTAATDSRDA